MIKLEALRVFVTVAEIGNIREAAERIGRTPSAVSMALKQLEEELGAPLFESDRKNALTALGRFTLEHSRRQISGFDKALSTIRAFAQNQVGRLTIACVPSIAANLIPPLVTRFTADRPGVDFELFDTDSAGVAALVEAGQVDFGVSGPPRTAGVLRFEPLFRDRFKVVCSVEGALAQLERPASWADLEAETLIRNGSSDAIEAPQYRALAAKATLMVRNVTSLVAMAGAGLGVTLLPALSTLELPQNVRVCDLEDDGVRRTVGLVERKDVSSSPVATAFRSLLKREVAELVERLGFERS